MEELIQLLEKTKPGVDFRNGTDLYSSGTLNSLAMISIIAALTEAYGVQIPFTEMVPENFESAEAIYRMLERIR